MVWTERSGATPFRLTGSAEETPMNRVERVASIRQVHLERRLPTYWRVTFDNPPCNIFGPETVPQLEEIVAAIETDEKLKVVVFDSAVEGFFLTHYNFLAP